MKSFLFVSNNESNWPKEGKWSAHLSLPNSQLKCSNRINQEKEASLMLKWERLYLHNSRSEEGCQGQAGTSAPATEHSGRGHRKWWKRCSNGASEAEEQWVQTERLWSTFAGNGVPRMQILWLNAVVMFELTSYASGSMRIFIVAVNQKEQFILTWLSMD